MKDLMGYYEDVREVYRKIDCDFSYIDPDRKMKMLEIVVALRKAELLTNKRDCSLIDDCK